MRPDPCWPRTLRIMPGRRLALVAAGLAVTTAAALADQHRPATHPSQTREAAPTADAVATARALVDQGRARDAVTALLPVDRSDPRVAALLGVAYYHADDPVRAIDTLAPLISDLLPDSELRREAVQVLGLSYYIAGRLADALPPLEETSRWATTNIELAQVLGMAYIQTRQPEKAREALARAFGVDPHAPAARVLAAQMMIRVEFFEMAEAELHGALAANPRLPRANFLLATNATLVIFMPLPSHISRVPGKRNATLPSSTASLNGPA